MSILGTVLLAAALAAALVAMAGWLWAARTGRGIDAARWASGLCFASVAGAAVLLETALLTRSPNLDYVAKVTDAGTSAYYRFTSLWSAMEGSLLLWLLVLAAVALLFTFRRGRLPERIHTVASAVLWGLTAAFGAVALVGSPFLLSGDAAANRPSPLLQDHPAMGIHPPLLYAGFAALAVPYALSVASLAAGKADVRWGRAVHNWTVAAWLPLTAGILLGAWWSYAVLGWGGYWAWDPVENASLMPWLLATALLHSAGPRTRGAGWRSWTLLLAAGSFIFVLLAIFLTRSGVVQSIHAFSTSPLGPLLLCILLAAVLLWAVSALTHRRLLKSSAAASLASRPAALQAQRVLLVLATLVVLAGSVLPAILLAVTGDQLSVGAPWYARVLGPLALAILALMAVGPLLSWDGSGLRVLAAQLRLPAAASAAAIGVAGFSTRDVWLAVVVGLAVFVLATMLVRLAAPNRNRHIAGALLAHLGIAVGAVAVLAGGHAAVTEQTVPVGGSVVAGSSSATLVGIDRFEEGPRITAEAQLLLANAGTPAGTLTPQLRWYDDHGAMLAGPAIRSEPFRDVYATLLDVDPAAGTATVRLAVTPLTGWLWISGALIIAGGAISGWPSGRRPVSAEHPGTRNQDVAA